MIGTGRRRVLAGALAWAAVLARPAAAHHSLAAYDSAHPVEMTGEVTEFSFTQPHPYLVIEVRPGERWKLEMDNLFELVDVGMTKATFRTRDRVKVAGSPDRAGARQLYLRRLDRPADGLVYEQVGTSPRLSIQRLK